MANEIQDNGWRFAQCFGEKGDLEEINEGNIL